jgi:hypothetical protein
MIFKVLSLAAFAIPATLFAQANDGPFQVNYASHLSQGDGVVNVTNDGFMSDGNTPVANGNSYGDICVNIYVYAPDQELAACCTCLVTPNALHSWPISFGPGNLLTNLNNTTVRNSIFTAGTGNGSVVIKLLGTLPDNAGASVNDSCPRPDVTNAPIAAGLLAWATHSHPTNIPNAVSITETRFEPGNLSAGEFNKLRSDCSNLLTRGSGSVCPNCQLGGLAIPAKF